METRTLAALVSSLVSQALVLLLRLLPASASSATTATPLLPPSSPPSPSLPLLIHLLSLTAAAAAAAGAPSRKRKRDESPSSESSLSGPPAPSGEMILTASPDQYRLCFRMSSSTFEWLSGLLEPLLDFCEHPSGPALRPSSRLAIGLFRLATGCPYRDVARRFGVPEPAARFCTKRLCRVLCTNFRFWLAFPSSPTDLRAVSSSFEAIPGGFPYCCGAIVSNRFLMADGTSVIAQVVADPNSRILNITTGYQGRKAGAWSTLRSSSLYRDVKGGNLLVSPLYLVGGDQYPLQPWLMVPYADPLPGSKEEDFNSVHSAMLQPAISTASSLRSWGILSRVVVEERKMAVACIGTCAILHNMLLAREDYSALPNDVDGSLLDAESSRCTEDMSMEECNDVREAANLRDSLAKRARESLNSNRPVSHQ